MGGAGPLSSAPGVHEIGVPRGAAMRYTPGARPYAAGSRLTQRPGPMNALLILVDTIISLYIWALIIHVVLTWLVQFNVVNTRNRFVYMVGNSLYRLTEPALRPIRRVIPHLGGLDISPVVLIIGLWFVRNLMFEYLA